MSTNNNDFLKTLVKQQFPNKRQDILLESPQPQSFAPNSPGYIKPPAYADDPEELVKGLQFLFDVTGGALDIASIALAIPTGYTATVGWTALRGTLWRLIRRKGLNGAKKFLTYRLRRAFTKEGLRRTRRAYIRNWKLSYKNIKTAAGRTQTRAPRSLLGKGGKALVHGGKLAGAYFIGDAIIQGDWLKQLEFSYMGAKEAARVKYFYKNRNDVTLTLNNLSDLPENQRQFLKSFFSLYTKNDFSSHGKKFGMPGYDVDSDPSHWHASDSIIKAISSSDIVNTFNNTIKITAQGGNDRYVIDTKSGIDTESVTAAYQNVYNYIYDSFSSPFGKASGHAVVKDSNTIISLWTNQFINNLITKQDIGIAHPQHFAVMILSYIWSSISAGSSSIPFDIQKFKSTFQIENIDASKPSMSIISNDNQKILSQNITFKALNEQVVDDLPMGVSHTTASGLEVTHEPGAMLSKNLEFKVNVNDIYAGSKSKLTSLLNEFRDENFEEFLENLNSAEYKEFLKNFKYLNFSIKTDPSGESFGGFSTVKKCHSWITDAKETKKFKQLFDKASFHEHALASFVFYQPEILAVDGAMLGFTSLLKKIPSDKLKSLVNKKGFSIALSVAVIGTWMGVSLTDYFNTRDKKKMLAAVDDAIRLADGYAAEYGDVDTNWEFSPEQNKAVMTALYNSFQELKNETAQRTFNVFDFSQEVQRKMELERKLDKSLEGEEKECAIYFARQDVVQQYENFLQELSVKLDSLNTLGPDFGINSENWDKEGAEAGTQIRKIFLETKKLMAATFDQLKVADTSLQTPEGGIDESNNKDAIEKYISIQERQTTKIKRKRTIDISPDSLKKLQPSVEKTVTVTNTDSTDNSEPTPEPVPAPEPTPDEGETSQDSESGEESGKGGGTPSATAGDCTIKDEYITQQQLQQCLQNYGLSKKESWCVGNIMYFLGYEGRIPNPEAVDKSSKRLENLYARSQNSKQSLDKEAEKQEIKSNFAKFRAESLVPEREWLSKYWNPSVEYKYGSIVEGTLNEVSHFLKSGFEGKRSGRGYRIMGSSGFFGMNGVTLNSNVLPFIADIEQLSISEVFKKVYGADPRTLTKQDYKDFKTSGNNSAPLYSRYNGKGAPVFNNLTSKKGVNVGLAQINQQSMRRSGSVYTAITKMCENESKYSKAVPKIEVIKSLLNSGLKEIKRNDLLRDRAAKRKNYLYVINTCIETADLFKEWNTTIAEFNRIEKEINVIKGRENIEPSRRAAGEICQKASGMYDKTISTRWLKSKKSEKLRRQQKKIDKYLLAIKNIIRIDSIIKSI